MYGVAKLQYSIVNTQIRHTNILEPAPTSSSTPLPAPPTALRHVLRVDPYGVIFCFPRVLAQAAPSKGPPSASVFCHAIRG